MRTPLSLVLGLTAAVVLAAPVQAQTSGSIAAKANVLASFTVTGTDLDFGNIAQTQTKTVAPADATAGKFTLHGSNNANVILQFTALPANVGNAALPLSAWSALRNSANSTAGATALVPTVGSNVNTTLSASGDYYVWVGATLTATAAPVGAATSSPITLQVMYQ